MRVTTQDNVGTPNHFCFLQTGRYYTQNSVRNGTYYTRTITAGRIYAAPVFIGKRYLIDRIAINVYTAVASSFARVGLYRSLPLKTLPGNLLYQCELDTGTTGVKENTGISVRVNGGRIYWLVFLASAAITVYMSHLPAWFLGCHRIEDTLAPERVDYLYVDQAYGSLPDPFPALANLNFGSTSTDGAFGPAIWFRINNP